MKFGLYLPNFGAFGEARRLADLAREAEEAGWDGFFIWDHVARDYDTPIVDPWVALAAIAMSTRRMQIGALVTPLPRRRPWKVAREAVSVDRLSGGRLVFGAGIGSGNVAEWERLGEETSARVRARMLDEGLALLARFWTGEAYDFDGEHYRVGEARFLPTPVRPSGIPVWVASMWPSGVGSSVPLAT